MILKTLRVKKRERFGQLVKYVLTHDNELREDGFLLTHNIMSDDITGITKAFEDNDMYRTNKRKNSVLMYHEIMSFAPEDSENLTAEKLEDIAQEYIRIRGDRGLAIAKPHFEKSHWHVHFLYSGTEYRSNALLRMDNKAFEKIRKGIEQYQIDRYPELCHSIVHTNKPERERLRQKKVDKRVRKEKEYQAKKSGRVLDKERLSKVVQEMYARSKNTQAFLAFLANQTELESYFYRGKLAGIKYGKNKNRKYRFTTLGITKEMLMELEYGKKKVPKEPTFLKSVFRDKELERYLKKNRQEKQHTMLEQYKEQCVLAFSQAPKQRSKSMKRVFTNLLDASKTMNQFLFFLKKLNLQPVITDQKLVSVTYKKVDYNFKQLGLTSLLLQKQKSFEHYQQYAKKMSKEQQKKILSQEIETDLFTGFGGLFFL